jgi:carbon monoxide dehydrogenase subunit G
MKLTNEIALKAEPDQLFALLTDVEKVAPCLPGARLEGSDGDNHQGSVKIKVGPITAAYKGTVRFMEIDKDARRVVLSARGVDQHGSGSAEAKVDAQVRPHDGGSVLALETDLLVRGKVAQFGRGVLGDISQKMMEQFARNISGLLTAPIQVESRQPASGAGPVRERTMEAAVPSVPAEAEGSAAVNGLALVAGPLLKRAAPIVGAFAVGLVVGRLLRRAPRSLIDDVVPATVRLGEEALTVPVRRTISFR